MPGKRQTSTLVNIYLIIFTPWFQSTKKIVCDLILSATNTWSGDVTLKASRSWNQDLYCQTGSPTIRSCPFRLCSWDLARTFLQSLHSTAILEEWKKTLGNITDYQPYEWTWVKRTNFIRTKMANAFLPNPPLLHVAVIANHRKCNGVGARHLS